MFKMASLLTTFLLISACFTSIVAQCPTGWTLLPDNRRCILATSSRAYGPYENSEAQSLCRRLFAGSLGTIRDSTDNAAFLAAVKNGNPNGQFWLGLYRDKKSPTKYVWQDGSVADYTNWGSDYEPGLGNCVSFNSTTGKWMAGIKCGTALPLICETAVGGKRRRRSVNIAIREPILLTSLTSIAACPYEKFLVSKGWMISMETDYASVGKTVSSYNCTKEVSVVYTGSETVCARMRINATDGAYVRFLNAVTGAEIKRFTRTAGNLVEYEYNTGLAAIRVEMFADGQNHLAAVMYFEGCESTVTTTVPPTTTKPTTTTTKATTTATIPIGPCPCGWYQFENNCYLYVAARMDHNTADQYCHTRGGGLVSFTSWQEQDAINRYVPFSLGVYHMGLIKVDGAWTWQDGSAMTISNWLEMEPDDVGYNGKPASCTQGNFQKLGRWDDINCDQFLPLVCKLTRGCPAGWYQFENNCYLFDGRLRNHDGAQSFCSTYRAGLASVSSLQEQEAINRYVPFSMGVYHNGLIKTGGLWKWQDGSPDTFANWLEMEPDGIGYNAKPAACGQGNFQKLGKWDDINCDQPLPVLCKMKRACPIGWLQFENNCYIYYPKAVNHDSAQAFCCSLGIGAGLVSVSSWQEQEAINRYMSFSMGVYHMGLIKTNGTWKWQDGSPATYANWLEMEPDGIGYNAKPAACSQGNFQKLGKWDDINCDQPLPALCKMKR